MKIHGSDVEAVGEVGRVERIVGRAWQAVLVIDLEGVRIDVQRAVDVVHVVVEEVVRGMQGQNRLERGRTTHRDLKRVESSPGDPPHADRPVGAGHARQLGDDLDRVLQLDVGVLARRQPALGAAGAADVHLRHDVAAPDEVLVQRVVAPVEGVVLAVGEELEEDREALGGIASDGTPVRDRELHAVRQPEPLVAHGERVERLAGKGEYRGGGEQHGSMIPRPLPSQRPGGSLRTGWVVGGGAALSAASWRAAREATVSRSPPSASIRFWNWQSMIRRPIT